MSRHMHRYPSQFHFIFFILLSSCRILMCAASSSGDTFSLLDRAIKAGKLSKIEASLAKNQSQALSMQDAEGNTLLHRAAWHGQIKIGSLLIEAEKHTDPVNRKGYTPLDLAVMRNHEGFIKFMINACADHNRAFAVAVERNCPKSVKLLLSLGIDFSEKGPDGKTSLLEHAYICESAKVIPLLSSIMSSKSVQATLPAI